MLQASAVDCAVLHVRITFSIGDATCFLSTALKLEVMIG